VFTCELESVTACSFNCLIETEGHFKVTDSHIHGISGNISESEMVQDRDVVTTIGSVWPIE